MCVRDRDRPRAKARFLEPGGAGHLAIAIEREPGAHHRVRIVLAAWMDDGDTGTHRALADDEYTVARDERRVPDLHSRHIGDGIEHAGGTADLRGDSEISRARFRRLRGHEPGCQRNEHEDQWELAAHNDTPRQVRRPRQNYRRRPSPAR